MSDPENPVPSDLFDLRLLPSWLKEEGNPSYANFEGEDHPRREGRDDRRNSRPPQGRDQRNSRGPARQSVPGSSQAPTGARPPRRDGRQPGNNDPRRNDPQSRRQGPPDRRLADRPPRQEERPAPVEVHFLPEAIALEKVTQQLQSAPVAYPLFGVAKMFLQRPERHEVQIKPLPEAKLYKLQGTAHLSTDRSRLEAVAFKELSEKYFRVEVSEAPEIKGNFTVVARSGLTGKVFGPTNHHSFQTGIHKEYEERFSRRMSFADYQKSIETTKDPAAVEQWKSESRRVETYRLIEGPSEEEISQPVVEPVEETIGVSETENANEPSSPESTPEVLETVSEPVLEESLEEIQEMESPAAETSEIAREIPPGKIFASPQEAEAHFRNEILPDLIVETSSELLTGQQARSLVDRKLAASVRIAWEGEVRYPLGLVNAIRVKFNQQNLHIFKFKKRVLLISSLKPLYLDDKSESLSESIGGILRAIQDNPGIDRKGLVEKIVNADTSSTEEEKQKRKNSLISDLFWLVRQGNVIEFSDGTFDLPLGPKAVSVDPSKDTVESTPEVMSPAEESSPVSQEQ